MHVVVLETPGEGAEPADRIPLAQPVALAVAQLGVELDRSRVRPFSSPGESYIPNVGGQR